jgi:transcriptional regulator with XRE-family HTH domain
MSKLTIAEQIRTLRKSKGLSQELLAENAGINLRTLQRIESGTVVPRGETLRLLAQALDIPVEELAASEELSASIDEQSGFSMREDQGFLRLMNLSALSFWFIPFGNIIAPLVLWIFKRNEIAGVMDLGKRILNFQITWSIIFYAIICFGGMSGIFFKSPFMMLTVIALLYFGNTVFIFINTQKIVRGDEDVYSLGFKIIQ